MFIEKSGIASDCKGNNHRGSKPKVPFAVYKSIVERYMQKRRHREGYGEADTYREMWRDEERGRDKGIWRDRKRDKQKEWRGDKTKKRLWKDREKRDKLNRMFQK